MSARANLGLIEVVAADLRAELGDDFDENTFLDSLDGETDFMDIIGALIRDRTESTAAEAAAKGVVEVYSARAARMKARQDAINRALGKLLDAAGERQVKHPLGTVSRTRPRLRVEITDQDAVPTQLCRVIRTPDKTAIGQALEAGETIPGAELRPSEPGVSVRIK